MGCLVSSATQSVWIRDPAEHDVLTLLSARKPIPKIVIRLRFFRPAVPSCVTIFCALYILLCLGTIFGVITYYSYRHTKRCKMATSQVFLLFQKTKHISSVGDSTCVQPETAEILNSGNTLEVLVANLRRGKGRWPTPDPSRRLSSSRWVIDYRKIVPTAKCLLWCRVAFLR